MRNLILSFVVALSAPAFVRANDAEPWGIKHWTIGASLEEVGVDEVAHECRSDDFGRTYCQERPIIDGGYQGDYSETVARYPAKITEATFWHGEAVSIHLKVAGRTNGVIPPLTEKLGTPPEIRRAGSQYNYIWRNSIKETIIVIASATWDYFLIEIRSPKYWEMTNAHTHSNKGRDSKIDRAGDI